MVDNVRADFNSNLKLNSNFIDYKSRFVFNTLLCVLLRSADIKDNRGPVLQDIKEDLL